MGIPIGEIIPKKEIKIEQLKGKKIAIDGYGDLYEFLTTMPELTDKKGRLTSHLVGLFYRVTHFMKLDIKPLYVFDGEITPKLGKQKRFIRKPVNPRETTFITAEIVQEAKELLGGLGLPIVQAPNEGEAQAAYMAQRGDVWAVASEDYDCLIFGAPRMIWKLTFAKRRKIPSDTLPIKTYLIDLKKILKELKISHKKLIILSILAGTDFNPGGAIGVGPKTALELVRQYKRPGVLFKKVDWPFDFSWKEVYDALQTMPVTKNYKLRWKKPNKKAVLELLCKKHDFDEKRVLTRLVQFDKKALI